MAVNTAEHKAMNIKTRTLSFVGRVSVCSVVSVCSTLETVKLLSYLKYMTIKGKTDNRVNPAEIEYAL
jgi:hypothetical protein